MKTDLELIRPIARMISANWNNRPVYIQRVVSSGMLIVTLTRKRSTWLEREPLELVETVKAGQG